ncbi:MAG: glycosyltransferase family 4 protein [Anaerolineae bacterium]|nr:glycosyltransferase family 4 protein [Anaerolineae bacterium]
MKIAAVSTSIVPSTYANSIQVMKVCHALRQVNGEVCLWVPGEGNADWQLLAAQYGLETPFEIRWLRSQRFWRRYDFAWKAIEESLVWGADVVYTWLLQAAVLALWRGLPVILELHDTPGGKAGPLLLRLFARHHGKKRLLAITNALRQKLEQRFGLHLTPDEIIIAPNGVDLERYQGLPSPQESRSQLGLPKAPTALYSGHFYRGRGMGILFELAQRFPQIYFVWAGGLPEDRAYWQQRLDAASIRNVALVGFIENSRLPLYQAAADILLMPYERVIAGSSGGNSAEICSPMKMFDYMASGRAILSSDLPVIREVLNEENALLCPPEQPEAWATALQRLLVDPDFRSKIGQRAQADAAKYSWRERARRALEGFFENPSNGEEAG